MDFKERLAKITQRNLKVKHKKHAHWPLEKKIEAVTQFLVLGNMKQVSVLTGVNYDLLKDWKGSPWWSELEKEIRTSQNIELDTKLTKIVEKSIEATLDRVENGDIVVNNKTGEFIRRPAPLRDVHRVAVDTIQRRELLRDKQHERGESTQVSVEEHLKIVAQQMAKWFEQANKPIIELNTEDVTDVTEKDTNAVHDERKEGLQEGEPAVQQPSGRSGEEGGA